MANKNEVKSSIDTGKWLVYGMATFQAYAMGRTGYEYDPAGWNIGSVNVAYLILGAIVNLIIAKAAVNLPSLSANFSALKALLPKLSSKADDKQKRKHAQSLKKMLLANKKNLYSQIGFYVLMAFSVMMIAPGLYIIWSKTLPFYWLITALMSFVGAVLPDFAITVGGFISGGEQKAEGRKQNKDSKPSKQEVQVVGKGRKLQGASSKQGVQVAGASSSKLQVQDDKQVRKQPVQDAALLAYWQSHPMASDGDVASHFGVSRQAILQRRKKFIERGEVEMAEHGVQIVGIDISSSVEVAR